MLIAYRSFFKDGLNVVCSLYIFYIVLLTFSIFSKTLYITGVIFVLLVMRLFLNVTQIVFNFFGEKKERENYIYI